MELLIALAVSIVPFVLIHVIGILFLRNEARTPQDRTNDRRYVQDFVEEQRRADHALFTSVYPDAVGSIWSWREDNDR